MKCKKFSFIRLVIISSNCFFSINFSTLVRENLCNRVLFSINPLNGKLLNIIDINMYGRVEEGCSGG